jgi:hypothetical protein
MVMLIGAKNGRVAGLYASDGAVSRLTARCAVDPVLPPRTIAAALKARSLSFFYPSTQLF